MNLNLIDRSPWIVTGFGIGVSISLFVCFGVAFLLSMIRNLKFTEDEVLLFTVLFYGLIFFIAHLSVRANMRQNKALVLRKSVGGSTTTPKGTKSAAVRAKTVLWNAITILSVAWLTPAVVIYWIAPRRPGMALATCCFIFGLVGATAFLLTTRKKNQTVYNRIIFFVGVCCGVLTVVHFIPVL